MVDDRVAEFLGKYVWCYFYWPIKMLFPPQVSFLSILLKVSSCINVNSVMEIGYAGTTEIEQTFEECEGENAGREKEIFGQFCLFHTFKKTKNLGREVLRVGGQFEPTFRHRETLDQAEVGECGGQEVTVRVEGRGWS